VSVNIGSFGVVLTGDLTVPDFTWTKIAFGRAEWDTGGRFDLHTGCFKAERGGKYHFAAGARLLIPTVAWCGVDLMLYKNGEPLRDLTPEAPLTKKYCSIPLDSRSTPRALLVRGFTTGEVIAAEGDVFEVYIRHDCGGRAYLTSHHPDSANGTELENRHPTYFTGVWHA
jgi:hypothetical protein